MRNGQGLHGKSTYTKSPHFEKKWSKNPLVMVGSPRKGVDWISKSLVTVLRLYVLIPDFCSLSTNGQKLGSPRRL